jgi:putative ABC transport system ATP-binding protein
MALIEIENVRKVYGAGGASTTVLHGVSAQIEEGEFVALMGPSGSGKTTLLTVLGAMNQPTEGRVVVDGIDIYALPEEKRADFRREYLGFVFQQHHLLPYLTALENVMLPLSATALPTKQRREKAVAALARVGLGDKGHRLPNALSGGEQGRVAIARALVNRPPLLLADEPTGNLDSRTGAEIIDLLRRLNERGQTVCMVTHSAAAAAAAHRVIRIHDGCIVEAGAAEVHAPATAPCEH